MLSTIGQSGANEHLVRDRCALPGGFRLIGAGDSEIVDGLNRFLYAFARVHEFGAPITAVVGGWNPVAGSDSDGIIEATTWVTSAGAETQLIDYNDNYQVMAALGGSEYAPLPVNWMMQHRFSATEALGFGGRILTLHIDRAVTADWINGQFGNYATSGKAFKCRYLYYAPVSAANQYSRSLDLCDRIDSDVIQVATLAGSARKFWHLGEGNPDTSGARGSALAGRTNALPDVLLNNTNSLAAPFTLMLCDTLGTTGTVINDDKYLHTHGALFYEVDGSGDWIPGTTLQHLGDSSWSHAGYGADEDPIHGTGPYKQFSTDRLTAYLDVTTLDRDQPPLVVMLFDSETPITQAQAKLDIEAACAAFRTALSAIGTPDPVFWLVHMPRTGYGDAPSAAVEAERNEVWGRALLEVALENPTDTAFTSIYVLTDGVKMNGSTEAEAWLTDNGKETITVGADPGTEIDLLTGEGADLLDGSELHPKNGNSAAFFALIASESLIAAPTLEELESRMATKYQEGSTIDHTPGSALTAGDVVVIGERIGVAVNDIAAGAKGALAIEGVFAFPKASSGAINDGTLLYWDVADQEATTDADSGTNKQIGYSVYDAADGATTVYAKINW